MTLLKRGEDLKELNSPYLFGKNTFPLLDRAKADVGEETTAVRF